MAQDLARKYYVKRGTNDEWHDVTTLFDGVKVLAIDGFNEEGDATNVYTAQWINSQAEDYLMTGDGVVRQNVDLSLTFIAGTRFASNVNVDTQDAYNNFVDYVARGGAFYIYSKYTGKSAHVVCLKSFKPTTQRLHRGLRSYILATIPLHCLDLPVSTII